MARSTGKAIPAAGLGVKRWISGHENNRNDCVVRAFANVKGITYPEALEIFKNYWTPKDGVYWKDAYKIFKQHGLKFRGSFGTTDHAVCFERIAHVNGDSFVKFKGCTVERMLKELQDGKFIVCIRGHAFCVIDGDILDYGAVSAGASVVAVFELTE